MKTCALPFCPVGIMYEGVGDLASQISPVNKVTSLLSGFFAFSPANKLRIRLPPAQRGYNLIQLLLYPPRDYYMFSGP